MRADLETHEAIQQLVERTYRALSVPGSELTDIFGNDDIAVAGSGLGELMHGPEDVVSVATAIAAKHMSWVPERITVWRRGDIAWAQILGYVQRRGGDSRHGSRVAYWTTGVFGATQNGWEWLYWGGSEPQEASTL
jgi:hypothetical protein